jgi:hypothetical protein
MEIRGGAWHIVTFYVIEGKVRVMNNRMDTCIHRSAASTVLHYTNAYIARVPSIKIKIRIQEPLLRFNIYV